MNLFNRVCKLTLTSTTATLDLSQFRVTFATKAADGGAPNLAAIRVYNLTDATINQIKASYKGVILEAGYVGNSGIIFLGDIKQFKTGKEGNLDRYLEMRCADGDQFWASATMNLTVAAGSPWATTLQQMLGSVTVNGQAAPMPLDPSAVVPPDTLFGGVLPRGKVMYGMARTQMSNFSRVFGARWFIDQGRIVLVPNASYRDTGQIVQLTGATGLIGYPEATDEGVSFVCLINPQIQMGGLVWLNNRSIQNTQVLEQGATGFGSVNFPAILDTDGRYRVLAIEYEGDTRGTPWYARCVALAINPDQPINMAISTGAVS